MNHLSSSYESLHESCTTYDLSKNTKIVIKITWLFWWRHHILRRSLKLNIFMNKSNSPYMMKEVYNTGLYWKCAIRKANKSFLGTLWTQIRLILLRIYSVFQQKTYKKSSTWLWKSADTAKTSLNFEKTFRK